MAEVAEKHMQSERTLQGAANTLDRRVHMMGWVGSGNAGDNGDTSLMPARFSCFDHGAAVYVIQQRALANKSHMRETIYFGHSFHLFAFVILYQCDY